MHRLFTCSFFLLACLGVFALTAPQAFAQSTQVQLDTYLETAKDDFDMLMLDEARVSLQAGIDLALTEGVRNETVAELFIFLGIVHNASGEDENAQAAFIKAVETFPAVELDPLYATPDLEALMNQARQQARPPAPDPESDQDSRSNESDADLLEDLVHEPVRRGRGNEEIVIEARVPEDLPVFRVYLYFRRFGEDDFQRKELLPRDSVNFAVTLEPHEVYSSQIEYYISGENRAGESITEAGRRALPFRITLLGDTDRTTPPNDRQVRAPVDSNDPARLAQGARASGFYTTLLFGSDLGFLPGTTPPTANAQRIVTPGIAPAFAHAALDLGWRISALNNLGLYFRWQFSPAQNFDLLPEDRFDASAPFWQHEEECFGLGLSGDCLFGVRYQRVITTKLPQFYSSVGLGVGRIRNWLRLKEATSLNNPNPACMNREIYTDPGVGDFCYIRDTVRTGWAHFGIGGGMYFPMNDKLDLVADTYLMILVPDTSVNLDLNVGLRFRL